jgi:acyl-CoA dehydrogenase
MKVAAASCASCTSGGPGQPVAAATLLRMPFGLTLDAEQQELLERVRRELEGLRGWYRHGPHGDFSEACWEALARAGALAAAVPAEYGGRPAGLMALALAMEELGAVGLPSMVPILTSIDALVISRHGGEELRRRLLPPIAQGERRLCLGVTEAAAGFNTFNIRTRAERQGDVFRVDGTKIFISGADTAGAMLLLARSLSSEECAARGLPKSAGLTWLVIDLPAAGLEMRALPTRGEGTLRQFEVQLTGVAVPAENLVGREGEGTVVLLDLINPERILVSAMLAGTARHCLDVASGHARERRVFGDTPIGRYQSVQHPLAEVEIRREAVRLMTWRAAAAADAGAPAKELGALANAAKFLAGELGVKAVEAALNALGGRGFDERAGIIHLLEPTHLLRAAPISAGLILNQVAEQTLGLPRSY